MSVAVHRFLPWARRGLSSAIPAGANGAAPPSRAVVEVSVKVTGVDAVSTRATLNGPGDVIGLDRSVIVRTFPTDGASSVEPNYFAAVDLDQPELPWLFTPTGAAPGERLAPWLVLAVVEDRPGVTIVPPPPGAPLPVLTITSGASAELPDLTDSWAWAHAQLLDSDAGGGSPEAVGAALRDHPNANVSRLVCPRRLRPNASWLAVLVPAFDAGVKRGLGLEPGTGPLAPAWTGSDTASLPVYFHWRFTTGPEGDFESLARRLKPFKVDSAVGRIAMHVGAAAPPIVLPTDDPGRIVDMDGALMAPTDEPGSLTDIVQPLRDGLTKMAALVADAADGILDGQGDPTPESGQPVGPPVYGQYAVRRRVVAPTDPLWFREANTDPRSRVAAGLGAEVLRANQEDVVAAAWEQVGDVLAAEAALSRARLSLEAGRRFRERHILTTPPDRLLHLAAPMAGRAPLEQRTVASQIDVTSMPSGVTDPAARRMLSPTGRMITRASGLAGTRIGFGGMVARLAEGHQGVDATAFAWTGVDGAGGIRAVDRGDGTVDYRDLGIDLVVRAADAERLLGAQTRLAATPAPIGADAVRIRDDVATTGIVSRAALSSARLVAREVANRVGEVGTFTTAAGTDGVLTTAIEAAATAKSSVGVVVDIAKTGLFDVKVLSVKGNGNIFATPVDGGAATPVLRISPALDGIVSIRDVLAALPPGALTVRGVGPDAVAPVIVPGVVAGELVLKRQTPAGPIAGPVARPIAGSIAITIAAPLTDQRVIGAFRAAAQEQVVQTVLAEIEPVRPIVAYPLAAAAASVLHRCDPDLVQVARRDAMVSFAGNSAGAIAAGLDLPGWRLPPLADRVMAYPHFPRGAYEMLAAFDRTRFCPGIDQVPTDSVTLLRTNPRFIAAFLAGLNQETERELMWRRFPTDLRGTPFQHFWTRLDGRDDIRPMNEWAAGGLPEQTADPKGLLVLLIRGQLLRRYPNTIVVAVPAVGPRTPSPDATKVMRPIVFGRFDPDVSFFGFPLETDQVVADPGWFFALMEPPTEPRFGLDETSTLAIPTRWDDAAWQHLPAIPPGRHLTTAALRGVPASPAPDRADHVAAALFQRPFKLIVHAKYLVRD